jgi:hypothetical protein
MTETPALPRWIIQPDGARLPFDPEAFFHHLFWATARLGKADPFRARELADAVLHFLAESDPGDAVSSDAARDIAIKVTRELGHLPLAAALSEAQFEPESADAYPTEIIEAERQGLLTWGDINTSSRLAGSVLSPRLADEASEELGMTHALEAAAAHTGHFVAIDGPEFLFVDGPSAEAIRAWVGALDDGLRRSGLRAVVNLNSRMPPPWAAIATGGLFPNDAQTRLGRHRADACDAILDELAHRRLSNVRIDWHLSDFDFQPDQREWFVRVRRWIQDGVHLALVMDRPRRPIALAEGLDREHPAVFAVVGVRVDRLASHLVTTGRRGTEALWRALPVLASLARSAGHARLRMLRSHAGPDVIRGFLLDRARLLVVPVGTSSADCTQDEVIGEQQVRRALLGGLLRMPSLGPPSVLDSAPPWSDFEGSTKVVPGERPRDQLQRAVAQHADTETGTAVIPLPRECSDQPENLADLVEFAFRLPGLVRVRFFRQHTVSPTPSGHLSFGE